MKKKYIIISAFLVVAMALSFVVFKGWNSLDEIVELAIENYGSKIIGADVQVSNVVLNLREGQATLSDIRIGNPEGFETDYAVQLDQIKVTLNIGTITSDLVVIKEVLIQAPVIVYELASGGSNIDTLANNAQTYSGSEAQSDGKEDKPKIIIENFLINDGHISVSHSMLRGKSLSVGMPDIYLQGIGKDDDGATPGEVAEQIMDSIKTGVGVGVATLSIGNTFNKGATAVKKGADGVLGKAKDAGDKLKGMFK
jgi:uncharacterized protein involved in outer membrane biogenesis